MPVSVAEPTLGQRADGVAPSAGGYRADMENDQPPTGRPADQTSAEERHGAQPGEPGLEGAEPDGVDRSVGPHSPAARDVDRSDQDATSDGVMRDRRAIASEHAADEHDAT